jgi:Tol biopolymer transport system component
VLLAGLIGLALVAFAPQRWRHATKFAALTEAPFTALPGQAGHPAFSPDGSRIAFEWTGDIGACSKSVDLYLKAIGSEDLIRLTKHPSNWISPAWSPDGSQIAFIGCRKMKAVFTSCQRWRAQSESSVQRMRLTV